MANLISLFGAIKANGKLLIQNPSSFFQDVTPANILYVKTPVSILNINGTPIMAFEIQYQTQQGLTQNSFFLPVSANLVNIADFLAGLIAVGGARNQFTTYTNLFKTSNQPSNLLPGNQSVLINNDFEASVSYLASQNLTAVTVNQVNSLSNFIMFFTGDQNSGGSLAYSYFTKTGNV